MNDLLRSNVPMVWVLVAFCGGYLLGQGSKA